MFIFSHFNDIVFFDVWHKIKITIARNMKNNLVHYTTTLLSYFRITLPLYKSKYCQKNQ